MPPPIMTRDHTIDWPITEAEEFEAALAAIVESAVEKKVDVPGAWEFTTRGSTHDWDVEIVELARNEDGRDDDQSGL